MSIKLFFIFIFVAISQLLMSQTMKKLTPEEQRVILNKGTEKPFTGKYYDFKEDGVYTCKQCDAPLFKSTDKFDSGCGWPSFDDEVKGALKRMPDTDGIRTEIICGNCEAHLGHVFKGEDFTLKNTRHCVNSISLNFVPSESKMQKKAETAIFAGGCFWGVEHLMKDIPGVQSVEVGYIGGKTPNPTYQEVCTGKTDHAEAAKITFDPSKVSYETIAQRFFEIHDPSQLDKQGPDIGNQYRSEVFYTTPAQKNSTDRLISILKSKGYKVVTKVTPASTFWKAENYHQDYYEHKGTQPYCHSYTKKF